MSEEINISSVNMLYLLNFSADFFRVKIDILFLQEYTLFQLV